MSENNRKARFYTLTAKGQDHLVEKTGEWQRLSAVGLILGGLETPGLSGEEA